MSDNQCELHTLLDKFSELIKPVSYLEVGVREGDSLERVLRNVCPVRLYLCDDWGRAAGGTGRGSHEHIQAMLDEQAINVNPVYIDGNSHVLLKEIRTTFQMITVDGDHSEEGAAQDLVDCWPLLEPNGFLFFDDIQHPQHMYLDGVANRFVHDHADARFVRRELFGMGFPGCVVIQKILV